MTRTLLVALNVSDGSLLSDLAADVEADLRDAGHDVQSVRPWGSPLDQLTPTPVSLPRSILSQPPSGAEPPPTQET